MTDAEDVAGQLDRRVGLESPHAFRYGGRSIRRPPVGVPPDAPGDLHPAGLASGHFYPPASGADVEHQGVAACCERPLELPVNRLRSNGDRAEARHYDCRDRQRCGRRRARFLPGHRYPPFDPRWPTPCAAPPADPCQRPAVPGTRRPTAARASSSDVTPMRVGTSSGATSTSRFRSKLETGIDASRPIATPAPAKPTAPRTTTQRTSRGAGPSTKPCCSSLCRAA